MYIVYSFSFFRFEAIYTSEYPEDGLNSKGIQYVN